MAPRTPALPEFTRITGRIADSTLILRPALASYREPDVEPGSSSLSVDVLDAEGRIISRGFLATEPYSDGDALSVRGSILLPDDAMRVRISGEDVATTEHVIPPSTPSVRFIRTPEARSTVDGEVRLVWEASDTLESWLRYSWDRGESWMPLGTRLNESSATINVDDLPGGSSCCFGVSVTNGWRTATAISPLFTVARKSCRALITSPLDGAAIDGRVELIGNGWWLEAAEIETEALTWSSDRDGELGRGTYVVADLSPGRHVITLRAGTRGREGTASVRVTARPTDRAPD